MRLAEINIAENLFQYHPGAANLTRSPGTLISSLLPNILILAGVVLIGMIIYGGYGTLTDAGSSNQQAIAKHRAAITYGLIGFLIIVAAYFILQIISYTLTGSDVLINAPTDLNPI